jgi:hypothetical protein
MFSEREDSFARRQLRKLTPVIAMMRPGVLRFKLIRMANEADGRK